LVTISGSCRRSYVKPYVKRQKNDAADAEAICEVVTRPTMRFVALKSFGGSFDINSGQTFSMIVPISSETFEDRRFEHVAMDSLQFGRHQ
jgi:hypothetical protein